MYSYNIEYMIYDTESFHILNQARAGLWLTHAWFLEIGFVWEVGMHVSVCVCVCEPPRLLITSGVM